MQDFHAVTITTPNPPAGKPAGSLNRLACSSIIGDNVINSAGEALVKIKDVMIGPNQLLQIATGGNKEDRLLRVGGLKTFHNLL